MFVLGQATGGLSEARQQVRSESGIRSLVSLFLKMAHLEPGAGHPRMGGTHEHARARQQFSREHFLRRESGKKEKRLDFGRRKKSRRAENAAAVTLIEIL